MKFLPLLSTLLVAAAAAPLMEEAAPMDVSEVSAEKPKKAASEGLDMTANGVKILPRFSEVDPKDGAKRTTVKYGTWSVSSSKMLQTTKLAQGPCGMAGCYVTGMEATIRYPNGKEANIDTQAWLHHIALFGSGTGGGSIWAAGNERPTLRLNEGNQKYGIDFPSRFMMMVDLMTEDEKPKTLTLEITYEHVPKTTSGYKGATMYWLSIGEPAAKDGVYSFKTSTHMSKNTGTLLYSIGHMHDGGTDMRLYVGGKMVCKSVMHYNLRKGYTAGGGAAGGHAGHGSHEGMEKRDGHGGHGGHAGMDMEHISDPGACTNFGTVNRGERIYAEAHYDAVKHPLMVHNGKKENLMGNLRVYVGPH